MGTPASTSEQKKDRVYSASKSVASGLTDLAFSTAIFVPCNKIINKYTNNLFENPKSAIFKDYKSCRMFSSLINRTLKIALVPLIAYLNFRYIKTIAEMISRQREIEKKRRFLEAVS